MLKKSKPAQALAALLALVALSAMCAGGALPFAGTVGTPKDRAEAHATAAAIAPAIEATRTYQERVLPTIQAEEAAQAKQDIETKHTNKRAVSTAWSGSWLRILDVAKWCAIVSLVFWTGRGVAEAVSGSVERAKRARAYEPVQKLDPLGAYLFPRTGNITQMLTAGTWTIKEPRGADVDGAALLIEAKTGNKSARYRVTMREEARPTAIEAMRTS